MNRRVVFYRRADGRIPFRRWLDAIRSPDVRRRIEERVFKLAAGNLGDHRLLGGGVGELRLHFGPGFRIYFATDGPELVILLSGGDKASQRTDIQTARIYWEDHLQGRKPAS